MMQYPPHPGSQAQASAYNAPLHPSSPAPQMPASVASRKRGLSPVTIVLVTVAVGLAATILLFIVTILGAYGYYQVSGRIIPGVYVGGTPLDGMTVTEAAIALHKTWNLETQILVTNGAQEQMVSPAELGLTIDPLQTAQKAFQIGHDRSFLGNLAQMAVSLNEGWEVVPTINMDEGTARLGLDALTPQLSQPPKDATLLLEGTTLIPVPYELGYTIILEETLATLAVDPHAVLTSGILQVTLKPVMPRIDDVSAAMTEASRLMDTSANIQAYDPIYDEYLSWSVPSDIIASWLKIESSDQGPQVILDETQVAAYLNGLSDSLGPERYLDTERYSSPLAKAVDQGTPLIVEIYHHPTTYIVQPGDTLLKISWKVGMPLWMILQANPDADPDALWVGGELVIPSKDKLLPLPVVPNKRIVISISKQRLWVYQDGAMIADHVISTGIDRSPTQPGIFQVQTHDIEAYASVWDLYMPNFLGIYEAWPGFLNGIHGLPTLSNGRRLWANILGTPASYGCIILDLAPAEWLYNWAEDGVVVEIVP